MAGSGKGGRRSVVEAREMKGERRGREERGEVRGARGREKGGGVEWRQQRLAGKGRWEVGEVKRGHR